MHIHFKNYVANRGVHLALRMAVRSSVYKKQTASHEHTFGAEQYDAEQDLYYRLCSGCSHRQEYEKM